MHSFKSKADSLLYRLGNIVKMDMVYIAKGGFWNTVKFAVSTLGSLAVVIAFGNLLPKETYGIYSYLISLGGTLSFLTLSGVSTAIIRAVARGERSIVHYAFKLQLRYNILAVLTIASASFYYLYKGNLTFSASLIILAVAIPLSAAYFTFEPVLIGEKKFDLLAKLVSISTLIGAVALVTAVAATTQVVIIIAVSALTSLFSNIIIFSYISRSLPHSTPSDEAVQELRRTSFHLTGAGLASSLGQYIDKIVLFQVAGPIALATYGFAIAGPEKLKGLIKNWTIIALPKLAERPVEEIRHIFYKRFGYLFLLGIAMSVVYILLSPILFQLFLPKYLDSIRYSQAYSLSLIIVPPLLYIGTAFYGLNMLRAVYMHSLGSQIMRIALLIVFGWRWQTWGLVVAVLLSYCLSTIYGLVIWEIESRRIAKIHELK